MLPIPVFLGFPCGSAGKESEVAQSCSTLCNPMDCSLPGSSFHGIFQARVPEWVAFSFSTGSSQPRHRTRVSRIAGRCFTLWATKSVCSAGDLGSTSGLGRSPGEEKGYPLQYSGEFGSQKVGQDWVTFTSLHIWFSVLIHFWNAH